MAILKKVSGVYQDIGGLSKKVGGVVSDADSAWVKENGIWVEKWANYNPILLNNKLEYSKGYVSTEDVEIIEPALTIAEMDKALSSGYTNIKFTNTLTVTGKALKYYFSDCDIDVYCFDRVATSGKYYQISGLAIIEDFFTNWTDMTHSRTVTLPITEIKRRYGLGYDVIMVNVEYKATYWSNQTAKVYLSIEFTK